MAITVRTNPAGTPVYPTDYGLQNNLQQATQRGYARVDLDDYADGATAPEIVVGSEFEVDGDIITVETANEAITGIGSIPVSTTFYIYYDVSAVDFIPSATVPTWDTALGGWYNGDDRALFRGYKNSSGEYDNRVGLDSKQRPQFLNFNDDITYPRRFDQRGIANTLSGSSVTKNTVFDFLSQHIPDTNDTIQINGLIELTNDTNLGILVGARRIDSTNIQLLGFEIVLGSSPVIVNYTGTLTDGDSATFVLVSISVIG